MTESSSTGSSLTSEDRRRKLAKYSTESKKADATADLLARDEQVRLVCDLLLRGKPRADVADRVGLTVQEVAEIEEMHFASVTPLSEQAMLSKQLMRLELLLDKAYELTLDRYGTADDFSATLAIIKEISELVGLKKTRLQAEVKVINERQVPIIVNYTQAVVTDMMSHIQPLLTKAGARQLEAKREEWFATAANEAASSLTEETATLTM